ncbi:monoglyceride lipase-like [Hibiscus syriacus]|uniref:Monoglyceride lipase-like n=1 Tax=Hibiscus syriacus TaxID=106335 RepID=A0A6A2Y811_HIBSY|nr:uncharacterized protein LOC120163746 [Hibiscus syriacus]KAE8677915.1 monoglyceride lipase-like [Hibiscus syriacus]
MGDEYHWQTAPPTVAPLNLEREEHWRRFDNSVNAVSFGFVATAILISMFLVMAIFERFLRPASFSSDAATPNDLESQAMFNVKLNYPSPKMTVYVNEVSVLMPGEEAPTFIAHPAPVPCPPNHTLKPLHQLNQSRSMA